MKKANGKGKGLLARCLIEEVKVVHEIAFKNFEF